MFKVLQIAYIGLKFIYHHRHDIVNAHRVFVKHDTDLEKVVDFIDSAPNNFRK